VLDGPGKNSLSKIESGKQSMAQSSVLSGNIKQYFRSDLKQDLLAATTVTLVAVPQATAYAAIVGVNPIYGLYSAIIPAIIGAIFGSSNHVVTGPTNTVALATSGVLLAVVSQSQYPEFVFAMAILSGLFKLLMGVFKLGVLIRYVSNSVLTGFLTGAAGLIIMNQIPKLLGLSASTRHDLIGILEHVIHGYKEINFLVLALGLACILILLIARRYFPKFPSALVVIFLIGGIVQVFDWQNQGVQIIGSMGDIGLDGMRFHFPDGVFMAENAGMLLTGAGAVALLSLLEAVSVAKTIAIQTGQRIDVNREFIGQGLASMMGGFFRGIPTSGSLTRSAVNFGGGAVTWMSSGISGLLVLIALVIFKDWIGYIPMVSLAGIVIVSALHMIDLHHIAITWRGRTISKVVIATTLISVLVLPLQISIYLGVGLSILFYLVESSHLELSYLVLNGNNKFAEKSIQEVFETKPEVAVINVEGPLFFAAVQDLEDQVTAMFDAGVKLVVLRVRRMHLLASSGISTLEVLVQRAKERGGRIMLAGVSNEVLHTLQVCGLDVKIDKENIFLATEIPYESTRKAVMS
jgi:SulP family sulfate permease